MLPVVPGGVSPHRSAGPQERPEVKQAAEPAARWLRQEFATWYTEKEKQHGAFGADK